MQKLIEKALAIGKHYNKSLDQNTESSIIAEYDDIIGLLSKSLLKLWKNYTYSPEHINIDINDNDIIIVAGYYDINHLDLRINIKFEFNICDYESHINKHMNIIQKIIS